MPHPDPSFTSMEYSFNSSSSVLSVMNRKAGYRPDGTCAKGLIEPVSSNSDEADSRPMATARTAEKKPTQLSDQRPDCGQGNRGRGGGASVMPAHQFDNRCHESVHNSHQASCARRLYIDLAQALLFNFSPELIKGDPHIRFFADNLHLDDAQVFQARPIPDG